MREMRFLTSGYVNQQRFDILISLTNIKEDSATYSALKDHFVRGMNLNTAAEIEGLRVSNLMRSVAKLNEVAGKIIAYNSVNCV